MHARPATHNDVEAICRICADSSYTPERVAREVDTSLPSWGGWFVACDDVVIAAGAGGMTGAATGELFVLYADPARPGKAPEPRFCARSRGNSSRSARPSSGSRSRSATAAALPSTKRAGSYSAVPNRCLRPEVRPRATGGRFPDKGLETLQGRASLGRRSEAPGRGVGLREGQIDQRREAYMRRVTAGLGSLVVAAGLATTVALSSAGAAPPEGCAGSHSVRVTMTCRTRRRRSGGSCARSRSRRCSRARRRSRTATAARSSRSARPRPRPCRAPWPRDQYVELAREKTDKIFVVLAEFGNERAPGLSGPGHGPEHARARRR